MKTVNQSRKSNIQPLGITQKEEKTNEKKAKIAQENFLKFGGIDLQIKRRHWMP